MSKPLDTDNSSPLVTLETTLRRSDRALIALAGNPNSGKTTLFNVLTKGKAKIGNYPGVTVERWSGQIRWSDGYAEIIDIPGLYSLNVRSADEQLALNELLGLEGNRVPDLVLLTVDALALERSLYLTMQVLEFGLPVVVAVNMMDAAAAAGIRVDCGQLTRIFGAPFVPVSARRNRGIAELMRQIDSQLSSPSAANRWLWEPSQELSREIDELTQQVAQHMEKPPGDQYRRALALWLLMSAYELEESRLPAEPIAAAVRIRRKIEDSARDLDQEAVLPRYHYIDENQPHFIRRPSFAEGTITERIDAVLTHPVWGSLVFIFVMLGIFQSLFSWSVPFMDLIEGAFSSLAAILTDPLPEGILREVLADGVIPGVTAVVVFLPQILFLFLFLSILEGTGYLARTAFLTDRILYRVGLHGKAFVPMISGYACAIPAIMAVRTIENRRDRLLTIMVIPLMSCSARLPVYTLIIAALFPANVKVGPLSVGSLMLFSIYVVGTLFALLAAWVLGRTAFKGARQPMLLELPPYHVPSLVAILRTLVERAKDFLGTAGRTILIASIVLWALLSFPRVAVDEAGASGQAQVETTSLGDSNQLGRERLQNSFGGRLGALIEPVISPLGFDWKIGIGLVGALGAREIFVSTMGVVYGLGDETDELSLGLREAISRDVRPDGSKLWTPLTGISLIVFFMVAMQCVSTLAVVKQETGTWKWPLFLVVYLTILAYVASLVVYQGGKLLGFE
jgi:ferrous iron transport protein B